MPILNKMIVFVDTSYMTFYKIYAVVTWSKMSKTDLTMEIFIEKFKKSFLKEVEKIKKSYCNNKDDLIVFAMDDSREKLWRKVLYPAYKETREKDKNYEEFICTAFKMVNTDLLSNYTTIKVDTAEADDIIAVCRRSIPGEKCVIITNDNDFIQLHDDKTLIVNIQGKVLTERIKSEYLNYFLNMRIICGDKSDNISSIDKNIGEKSAFKLCMDQDKLKDKLSMNADMMARYNLNMRLISFDEIPKKLQAAIQANFFAKIDLKTS